MFGNSSSHERLNAATPHLYGEQCTLTIPFCRRAMTFAALLLALTTTAAVAQDLSDEEVNPVDATEFDRGAVGLEPEFDPNKPPQAGFVIPVARYRSNSLGGEFVAQWMKLTMPNNQGGKSFVFWGARAVKLDNNSPLRNLQVNFNNGQTEQFQVGDVITRLDNVKINDGMFKDRKGVLQIVELDEHFGPTEFRWIKSGHSHVNVSKVTLTNYSPPVNNGGNPGVAPVAP